MKYYICHHPEHDPDASGLEWRDTWTKWGPFDRFDPAGEIK